MKEKKKIEELSRKEWNMIASLLSDKNSLTTEESELSLPGDELNTFEKWKQLEGMNNNKIDVEKAWSNLHSRIAMEEGTKATVSKKNLFFEYRLIRVAAAILIFAALGLASLYIYRGTSGKMLTAETGADQKNMEILLSDGSKVILNQKTRLVYPAKFRSEIRNVELTGEAFFDIVPDASKPFVIDAGKTEVKVLGTTFNVISTNNNNATEVFVKTGKVQVTDIAGNQSLTLDPGYLGEVSSFKAEKYLNNNPNYLAWNTNVLVYDHQKLEVVFKDLKRVFNLDIAADEPEILNIPLTTTFEIPPTTIDNQSKEDIIMTICVTFNLDNRKDGNTYHLSMK